jgi:hypothetical protein
MIIMVLSSLIKKHKLQRSLHHVLGARGNIFMCNGSLISYLPEFVPYWPLTNENPILAEVPNFSQQIFVSCQIVVELFVILSD